MISLLHIISNEHSWHIFTAMRSTQDGVAWPCPPQSLPQVHGQQCRILKFLVCVDPWLWRSLLFNTSHGFLSFDPPKALCTRLPVVLPDEIKIICHHQKWKIHFSLLLDLERKCFISCMKNWGRIQTGQGSALEVAKIIPYVETCNYWLSMNISMQTGSFMRERNIKLS